MTKHLFLTQFCLLSLSLSHISCIFACKVAYVHVYIFAYISSHLLSVWSFFSQYSYPLLCLCFHWLFLRKGLSLLANGKEESKHIFRAPALLSNQLHGPIFYAEGFVVHAPEGSMKLGMSFQCWEACDCWRLRCSFCLSVYLQYSLFHGAALESTWGKQ